MNCVSFLVALACFLLVGVDGIMFHLQPNTQKCLKEELQIDVFMSGEYEVSEAPGQKVDYVVSILSILINDQESQILSNTV